MSLRKLIALASVALAGAALSAGPATAAQSPVISDCIRHLRLTRHYSASQLEHALQTMPADLAQYTDCSDVIRTQLLAQLSARRPSTGARSTGSGGSGFPLWVIAPIAVVALGAAATALSAMRRARPSRTGP